MNAKRLMVMGALALSAAGSAGAQTINNPWSFAWDPHPEAAKVAYFELEICVGGACKTTEIPGGTATGARDIAVDPALQGDGTAVARACDARRTCSADSNTVALDRTPPQAPPRVWIAE